MPGAAFCCEKPDFSCPSIIIFYGRLLAPEDAAAKVKIETEHIDGIWYAGYVIAVRGEGAETRVLVTVAWHRRKKIKMVHAG